MNSPTIEELRKAIRQVRRRRNLILHVRQIGWSLAILTTLFVLFGILEMTLHPPNLSAYFSFVFWESWLESYAGGMRGRCDDSTVMIAVWHNISMSEHLGLNNASSPQWIPGKNRARIRLPSWWNLCGSIRLPMFTAVMFSR